MLPCVVSNVGKYSRKNIGEFINGELRLEKSDGFFTFMARPGDKVVLKSSGFLGGTVIAERTLSSSTEMDNVFFTIK